MPWPVRLVDTFVSETPVAAPFLNAGAVSAPRVWAVGPLMRAVADTLAARFNPVAVQGEVSGFSRAASGHCYFSLKDDTGQVRCAMFRRSADQLSFTPRDGTLVEAQGKLDVYGPRGDLQLIVENLKPAGQGALFERFLQLKARLEADGLFDAERKRALPVQPRSIAVVTSLGAAALRDVVTALRRRVPHIPVLIYPASVQGVQAPAELRAALDTAYGHHRDCGQGDVLLLVRGGGSLEDLWAFNDEGVVRTLASAPMPVVCGVGHETDFTLADFVADLRAPTPTAAAEMCAPARELCLGELGYLQERLGGSMHRTVDQSAQRLDRLAQRLGRPSGRLHAGREQLAHLHHRLRSALLLLRQQHRHRLSDLVHSLPQGVRRSIDIQAQRIDRSSTALALLDPYLVLERGYAFLTDADGQAITRTDQLCVGQSLQAQLADGVIGLTVKP